MAQHTDKEFKYVIINQSGERNYTDSPKIVRALLRAARQKHQTATAIALGKGVIVGAVGYNTDGRLVLTVDA